MGDAQLLVFPDQLMLYRIDPDAGKAGYVYLTVQRDLFGGAVLVLECGRIGSAGRLVRRCFADEGQAVTAVLDIARDLAGRGYMDGKVSKE